MTAELQPACNHVPVPVVTEGVDLESLVLVGHACAICGEELIALVPRPVAKYAISVRAA
jgi:hypothetical protein